MLEVLDDCDWEEVFGYANDADRCCCFGGTPYNIEGVSQDHYVSESLFYREDVVEIYGMYEGMNEEEDWLIAGLLQDGRHFYIEAGCDYTGWG